MKNYKIKIGNNPELSELVQRKAFELGCRWALNGNKVSHVNEPCLFFDDHGVISYSDNSVFFEGHPSQEISIPDFLELKPEKEVEVVQVYLNDAGGLFSRKKGWAVDPESRKVTSLKFNEDGTAEVECE